MCIQKHITQYNNTIFSNSTGTHKFRFIGLVLTVFVCILSVFSCASNQDFDVDIGKGTIIAYDAVNIPTRLQYPSDWYIFEEESIIKLSNVLAILTFPLDMQATVVKEDSFIAHFLISSLEEIISMHDELSDFFSYSQSSDVNMINGSSFRPNYIVLDVKNQNDLFITKEVLPIFLNIDVSGFIRFAFIKEYDIIIIKESITNTITFLRKINDNSVVVVYTLMYFGSEIIEDIFKKSLDVIISASTK